jgi:hypothetical protein
LSSVRKDPDKGVELEWELLDHDRLQTSPRSRQILDIGIAS